MHVRHRRGPQLVAGHRAHDRFADSKAGSGRLCGGYRSAACTAQSFAAGQSASGPSGWTAAAAASGTTGWGFGLWPASAPSPSRIGPADSVKKRRRIPRGDPALCYFTFMISKTRQGKILEPVPQHLVGHLVVEAQFGPLDDCPEFPRAAVGAHLLQLVIF